ncbi:DUF2513 domain-containing protein [Rubripirellula amarantea]|nr:DUF2513 domain-containing protein [Rubripirellula amarantea]
MRRDMKLVRLVLEFVEQHGSGRFKGKVPIEGYERDAIIYHLQLLADSGYVNLGQETLLNMGPLLLTWKGCDYLDELRRGEQGGTK